MKLTLILCSVMLALVVVPELVAARAKPELPRPGLDEKFEGTVHAVQTKKHTETNKWCDVLFNI